MSLRGEVIVECDLPGCHAEEVIPEADLLGPRTLKQILMDRGWIKTVRGHDVCPQCIEDGKSAKDPLLDDLIQGFLKEQP
jgi:hypothetical protein